MVIGPCNWVVAAKNRQGKDTVEWSTPAIWLPLWPLRLSLRTWLLTKLTTIGPTLLSGPFSFPPILVVVAPFVVAVVAFGSRGGVIGVIASCGNHGCATAGP